MFNNNSNNFNNAGIIPTTNGQNFNISSPNVMTEQYNFNNCNQNYPINNEFNNHNHLIHKTRGNCDYNCDNCYSCDHCAEAELSDLENMTSIKGFRAICTQETTDMYREAIDGLVISNLKLKYSQVVDLLYDEVDYVDDIIMFGTKDEHRLHQFLPILNDKIVMLKSISDILINLYIDSRGDINNTDYLTIDNLLNRAVNLNKSNPGFPPFYSNPDYPPLSKLEYSVAKVYHWGVNILKDTDTLLNHKDINSLLATSKLVYNSRTYILK